MWGAGPDSKRRAVQAGVDVVRCTVVVLTDIRALGIVVEPVFDPTTPRHNKEEPSMLVLSRQRDETIMIGDDVEITVVDIRGDKVRLGISAPRSIQVHRKEVYEAIRRENERAAELTPSDMSDVIDEDNRKRNEDDESDSDRSTGPNTDADPPDAPT